MKVSLGLLLQSFALLACVTLTTMVIYADCSCPPAMFDNGCSASGANSCCGCGKSSSQCAACTAEESCTTGLDGLKGTASCS